MKYILQVQYSLVSTYFTVAQEGYKEAERCRRTISALPDHLDEGGINDYTLLDKELYRNLLIYIIFLAFTIEALINKYLYHQYQAGKISKKLFNHLDEMTTIDKCGIATQICSNVENHDLFDYGVEPIQSLQKLFKLRNALVHSKQIKDNLFELNPETGFISSTSTGKPWQYNLDKPDDNARYLKAVKQLMQALQEIDPSIDSDWLNCDDWADIRHIIEE